jgi:FMN-dependent oxidoreductase (nitrilotriacetate monooxygenase family)
VTSAPAGWPAPLHLGVALDGTGWHPAAWREADAQPQRLFTAGYWTELAQQAERGLLDFLTIEDGLDLQSDDRFEADSRLDRVRGRLDAVLIAARAAPDTRHIGFVPTAITTHTEPFHLSKAIATLDYVSSGRAGIRVQVAVRAGTAAHFGRRESPPLRADRLADPDVQRLIADHFDEAANYVEVLRRLWDSWEDDAEIRDVTTGRFIDRNKLHYIEFEGRWFSVKGPSITPPPQGQPVVATLGHASVPYQLIAHSADVGFVTPRDAAHAAEIVTQIRTEQARAGRAAQTLHVFGDLVVFLDETETAAARPGPSRQPLRRRLNDPAADVTRDSPRTQAMTKQIHLAAHFPGVNNTTVWSDPAAGSHIEFDSFRRFAQTAERGKFDFLFLAEGLRLREQNGLIYDLDVVGRPDTFTILAALAAVTEHVGLTGTINSTFNEPYEVARQFASLDHLSGGRAAWNVVTSWDAFTGENFRRGGYLAQGDRYERARTFLATANELWDSWHGDEILADAGTGQFLATAAPGAFRHRDAFFDIAGQFNVPRSPQGRPVIFQAGDSDEGRDFAAASADAIFSRHSALEAGQAFYADVKGRLPKFGRTRGELLILPAATFVLGDTDAEAAEIARDVRRAQVSPQTALKFIEQLWNTELSGFDVDGPLPAFDPVVSDNLISKGRASVRQFAKDPVALAGEWRARAETGNLSAREVVIEVTGRQSFIGSAETIATTINDLVQADAADGYILVPHITPGGLTPFVDQVVPLLQERAVFRADYTGTTLRDHLSLAPLRRPGETTTTRAAS